MDLLRSTSPVPPLTMSSALESAALDLVRDQYVHDYIGSKDSAQGGPVARVSRYGRVQGTVAENIRCGSESAREVVMSWLVDDSDRRSGRRKNVLYRGEVDGGDSLSLQLSLYL